MPRAKLDVVVYGATSFVGKILCRYLVDQFGVNRTLRWAIAGRSQDKLEALRAELGKPAAKLRLLLADAADDSALRKMCAQTRVVVSTVGPYALFGEPLVEMCATSGTDYCDLTGEPQWIRRMLDRHESQAQASGARIVHCCGFDSIPSDLGVHFLQQQARKRFGAPCIEVKMRVRALRGGLSGGTAASLLNAVKEAASNPALRKLMGNPYALCPPDHGSKARQRNVAFATYDKDFKSWVAPFVMAAINTRVVQRSNALAGRECIPNLLYDEATLTGAGIRGRAAAFALAGALGGFVLASALRPTRWALKQFLLPAAGAGPSPSAQENGCFDLRFQGRTANGETLRCKVTGDRDPGYGSTAKMLGQAAACLALDIGKQDRLGGFWTPATIFGERLIERLQAYSGLTFEVG